MKHKCNSGVKWVDEFCRSCNVILGNRPHPSTMLRRMCYDDCSQDVFFLKPDEFHHKAVYSCTFLRVIALRRIKASFLSASSRSSASISTIPFIILVYRQVTYSINSLSSSSWAILISAAMKTGMRQYIIVCTHASASWYIDVEISSSLLAKSMYISRSFSEIPLIHALKVLRHSSSDIVSASWDNSMNALLATSTISSLEGNDVGISVK